MIGILHLDVQTRFRIRFFVKSGFRSRSNLFFKSGSKQKTRMSNHACRSPPNGVALITCFPTPVFISHNQMKNNWSADAEVDSGAKREFQQGGGLGGGQALKVSLYSRELRGT